MINHCLFRNGWLFALGLLGCLLTPQQVHSQAADEEEAASEEVSSSTPFEALDISGVLDTSYTFRNYDGLDDHDIYSYFSLRMDDLVQDKVDGAFSVFWHEDLNSDHSLQDPYDYDPFLDIDQSHGRRFRFYTGYIDVHDIGFDDSTLRAGRQFLEEIDYAHFDGGSYTFDPIEDLEIKLFGGRPVTFYSSSSGDSIYGTNVEYRFSDRTRAAARYYRYDTDEIIDDLGAIEAWHRWTTWIQSHAEFSLLNGNPYFLKTDTFFRIDAVDLDIILNAMRLFEPVSEATLNFNPYFPLMYSYEPFTYGSFYAIKGLGDYWSVTGGVDVRQSDNIDDPAIEFTNSDYVRGTLGVEFYPIESLTLAVNAEYWDVDPDDRFTGVSGEVEYQPVPEWTFTTGAEYGEYVQEYRDEFLYFFGEDKTFRISPDVITYFARVKWQPVSRIYSAATFEYEDNDEDEDDWYGLRLQVGVSF